MAAGEKCNIDCETIDTEVNKKDEQYKILFAFLLSFRCGTKNEGNTTEIY